MNTKSTDIHLSDIAIYLLPVTMRVPLKFGAETLTNVKCLRVKAVVEDGRGRSAEGWGETPLSVAWGWPSPLGFDERERAFVDFCSRLATAARPGRVRRRGGGGGFRASASRWVNLSRQSRRLRNWDR